MSKRQGKASYWQDAPMPRDQLVLFTDTLEDRIPADHPVRVLDEILSAMDWTEWEAESHGRLGQPPIHPSVMCKVLLFAMIRRIRSCRQIEYNLQHSIDFIWLAAGRTIDHSTLSEFRRKHPQHLKNLYRQMIQLAIRLGVAKLGELCIDGTRVQANASRFKTLRAETAERLLGELDLQIAKALSEMDTNDSLEELFDGEHSADPLPPELQDMQVRREKLRAIVDHLHEKDRLRKSKGKDPKKNPAQLPITDPDSRILPNKTGGYAPNYTPMIVTETENGFIVGADVLIGAVEHSVMTTMLDTVECDFGEKPEAVLADTTYSTGQNLADMEDREQELLSPCICEEAADNPAYREDLTHPVPEEELDQLPVNAQSKRFDKRAFIYVEEADCLYCPAGKKMPRERTEMRPRLGDRVEQVPYRCHQCIGCSLVERCRKNPDAKEGRKVMRDGHEAVRRRHHEHMQQKGSATRYKRRFHYGETPFAVMKTALGLRRFALRGIDDVRQEWLWGCTAFNLKKLIGMWVAGCATEAAMAVDKEG